MASRKIGNWTDVPFLELDKVGSANRKHAAHGSRPVRDGTMRGAFASALTRAETRGTNVLPAVRARIARNLTRSR